MPRGRLNEKYVQGAALNWLAAYYQSLPDVRAVVAESEVIVHPRSASGSGRADGLIVAQRTDGSILTVAMEAKSARTLLNISLWYHDERWLLHAVIAGGAVALLSLWIGRLAAGGVWVLVVPVLVFFLAGLGYLWLMQENQRYRKIDAIEQVKRYPANERWIAISTDAYNLLTRRLQDELRAECRQEGIGLLQVQANAKAVVREASRPQRLRKGSDDALICYARSELIRRRLLAAAEGGRGRPL